jgi:hypothetical protein
MREIIKRDEGRQAEIKIICNDEDDVIGVDIRLFQPISLVDFNFERLFAPSQATLQARMMAQAFQAAGKPGQIQP